MKPEISELIMMAARDYFNQAKRNPADDLPYGALIGMRTVLCHLEAKTEHEMVHELLQQLNSRGGE